MFFIYWRKNKLDITLKTLILAAVFGIAFGYVESACVIYLRAPTGLLPGYMQSLAEVQRQSIGVYDQTLLQKSLPVSLLTIELVREAATMIMLISVAVISAKKLKERAAIFLWTFAVWDILYYVHLYWTVRWPEKPTTIDVLFLIPEPWFAQVWFPILISALSLLAVFVSRSQSKKAEKASS
ncbi:MAG: hypothetical protein M1405_00875 [Patescibacteria group bacterium]|nr:hypothetical protein [Patescibacteria group bacterium]